MAPKRHWGNLIADLLPPVHAKGGPGSHLKARAIPWIDNTASLLQPRYYSSKQNPSATPRATFEDASLPPHGNGLYFEALVVDDLYIDTELDANGADVRAGLIIRQARMGTPCAYRSRGWARLFRC